MSRPWFKAAGALAASVVLILSVSHMFVPREVEAGASTEAFLADLDRRIPLLMDVYGIPGACISVVRDGETIWTGAYGYADVEDGRKMTPDTPLRVQSISKSVTAWGVMKLAQQGLIDLDSPVQQYLKGWRLPDSPYNENQITVRQLMSHTAGMPIGDFYNIYSPGDDDIPPLEQSLYTEAALMREPGEGFSYSNTGYNLLELMIEEVTGSDFSIYMEKEVLQPLGMRHASYEWSENLQPPVPYGYGLAGNAVPVYVYPEKGSGGLFATAGDTASFVASGMPAFADSMPVLSEEAIEQLYTPETRDLGVYSLAFTGYGLGYYIEHMPSGLVAVSHGGQGTGWMTHFHAVPETGDGIVILTNSQRSWPFIAYLLRDWASWCGFSSVGMARIILAQNALWAVAGVFCFIALLQLWRLVEGFAKKQRHFAPLSRRSRPARIAQFAAAALLFAVLIWCAMQEYLFLTSVLPTASAGLGVSLAALALTLLVSSLLPKREDEAKG